MDHFEDAMEDAQYIMALQDKAPFPLAKFKKPTKEELGLFADKYFNDSRLKGMNDIEYICTGSLGFYEVTIQTIQNHYYISNLIKTKLFYYCLCIVYEVSYEGDI